eukprot:761857-Prymnesium_polylepis.1
MQYRSASTAHAKAKASLSVGEPARRSQPAATPPPRLFAACRIGESSVCRRRGCPRLKGAGHQLLPDCSPFGCEPLGRSRAPANRRSRKFNDFTNSFRALGHMIIDPQACWWSTADVWAERPRNIEHVTLCGSAAVELLKDAIEVGDGPYLHLGPDAKLCTEIHHLLCAGHASDVRDVLTDRSGEGVCTIEPRKQDLSHTCSDS